MERASQAESHDGAAAAAAAAAAAEVEAEAYEAAHVHSVYEAIAPHFSSTRHKPWPRVAAFLAAQPPGSLGLDVGCGNGKYLPVNRGVHMLASDRSPSLVALARERQHQQSAPAAPAAPAVAELCVADGLALPYRHGIADFAICIAVIHHLSTRARRRDAIAALLARVRPPPPLDNDGGGGGGSGGGGSVLIYVWALEQSATSRRAWDARSAQDTLVPWVMRAGPSGHPAAGETFQRYYHLYREGELEEDVVAVGGRVVESGYDQDNWWVIMQQKQQVAVANESPASS